MSHATLHHLFTPLKIRGLELKNRLVMAAMGTEYTPYAPTAEPLKQRYIDFLSARARGGVGLIMLNGIGWARMDMAHPLEKHASAFTDAMAAGHKELTRIIHSLGAKIGIQVSHRGRQGKTADFGFQPVAPSAIGWSKFSEVPRELTREEIENLVERWSDAGKRAKDSGFDLVEIMSSHGYLLNQFLASGANKRTDEYGGDAKGRAKILTDIIRRTREKVGSDFVISCRISAADYMEGGVTIEDAKQVAPLLEKAGADMIDVSAGVYASYPTTVFPYGTPPGVFVPLAAEIKKLVSIPVVAISIHDVQTAESVLAEGKADLIAMGRPFLVDPELANKALKGDFRSINKCVMCNVCLDSFWEGGVSCTVNPSCGREKEYAIIPAPKAKKVMVIGGGVAGMEVARVCAQRGHKVSLYEETKKLGGQWLLAARAPHKQGYNDFIEYLTDAMEKQGVKIELGKKATKEVVEKQNPDVAIVAIGALQIVPPIPGVERKEVVTAWDVLEGKVKTGKKVLVIGGGITGIETAELLAEQGKDVTVVEMLERYASGMGDTLLWHVKRRIRGLGVKVLTSTKVLNISDAGVTVKTKDSEETWPGFETIVLALGVKSRNEIAEQLKGKVKEVYVIGDAKKPDKGIYAIRQGVEIGVRV